MGNTELPLGWGDRELQFGEEISTVREKKEPTPQGWGSGEGSTAG